MTTDLMDTIERAERDTHAVASILLQAAGSKIAPSDDELGLLADVLNRVGDDLAGIDLRRLDVPQGDQASSISRSQE